MLNVGPTAISAALFAAFAAGMLLGMMLPARRHASRDPKTGRFTKR